MRCLIVPSLLLILISCNQNSEQSKVVASREIDALKASPDNFKRLLENNRVRVLEYTLKLGAKDQVHTHPPKSSYIVTGGKLKVYKMNGEAEIFDEDAGTVSWMDHVGEHYVENIGATEIKIILTEVKSNGN